jgi:branched-chain amino acid transport system substrate-binding protein
VAAVLARAVAVVSCLATVAAGLAACGGKGGSSTTASRTTLTIYASQPLQGPAGQQSEAMVKAEKLALAEEKGRVGKLTIKYVALDDATAAANRPDPGQTATNARKAAQDPSTIAYLGEAGDGASVNSIPITNEAGILQVSPWDTPAALTRREGADPTEPARFYPSGKRTFVRVVPPDNVQAAAQASYQLQQGCTKTFVLADSGDFGQGLARQFAIAAKANGPEIVRSASFEAPATTDFAATAREVRSLHADCVLFAGITADFAARAFRAIHHLNATTKLFGTSGVAEESFTGALSPAVQRVTYITCPTLDAQLYPEAGRTFLTTYREKYGKEPAPAAIFGYEAMKLTLQAIENAGDSGNDRQSVIGAALKIKDRESVLGRYSIDGNGDTTLSQYGAYRVQQGKLVFDKAISTGK